MQPHQNVVEILHRAPNGTVAHKTIPWKRPATEEALADWIQEYLERLESGYKPSGYHYTPIPHCARVKHLGRVIVEWRA